MRQVLPLMVLLPLWTSVGLAAEVEVLFDGKDALAWSPMRDAQRLHRELSLHEIKQLTDPPALSWRFVPKSVNFNDLFLRRPIDSLFEAVRVRVRNEGAAFTFAAKATDSKGVEWTASAGKLPAAQRDWTWVEFPADRWQVAPWSRVKGERMTFPLRYFVLIAFGLKPGVEYHLDVARVEVIHPDRPVARVLKFDLPRRLVHGRTYYVALTFSLDGKCHDDRALLTFNQGRSPSFSAPLRLPAPPTGLQPGEAIAARPVRVHVPQFACGGEYRVLLWLGDARVQIDGKTRNREVATVTVEPRQPQESFAEVKLHKGAETIFINGEPHNGMAYTAYGPSVDVFRDFARAGVKLYSFSATPTEAGYGLSRTAWLAPDKYDFSQLDERALMVLQANPDAYFFPRLYLHAPRWWSEQHPDDIVLMDPGDGKYVPFMHSGNKPAPSWASEQWRKDTVEGLRRLIAHVEASPFADRCIGYHLASGTTEEWMMWGANENQWVDYSPANQARFRQWLRTRYGDVEALRRAWGDPQVTFETAQIPTKAQRQACQFGCLRDPAREQQVLDFYLYNSDLVADTICYFAHAVKEITHRRKTVGVFYGYLLQLCGEQRQQNAGHLALEKVLASPDVDFLCSPTSYYFRQLGGEGTSHFMSLFGSVRLHGKLWFDENDIRTSLSPGKLGGWGKPADVAGDFLQQDKELANVLVNGAAQWWFDVGGNRYDDPRLMAHIAGLVRSADRALQVNREPVDEVAFAVDEDSLTYLRVGDPLGRWLLVSQLPALHRLGAPVGHYLTADLPRLRGHKLFIFPTSFAPSARDRQAIEALKRDGHVLVFLFAPGLYR
ncbi:MAG: beta-galactosidase, partial [Armatimonadetes bacterium]|nr:beta-galactosidase [Armatimonadota bacterium]